MDTPLFVVTFTYASLALSDGFLILHARKEQCLLGNNQKVLVGPCNLTSRWQQWQWTEQGKLRLPRADQCLGLVSSTPWHSRNLALQGCAGAPRWKCYDNEPGRIGLADQQMFLRKLGYLAVVKAETKYHDTWLKYQLGDSGEPVKLNMCPTQGDVTEQLTEQTTYSSSFSTPSSFPTSEDPCSTMACFYNQTEKYNS